MSALDRIRDRIAAGEAAAEDERGQQIDRDEAVRSQ
jgi:hypothetical protein